VPALTPASPLRHLRPRGEAGSQPTTSVELFFDLVYLVLAVIVTLVLTGIAVLELRASGALGLTSRHRPVGAPVP
jgi:hypothetical protein